MLLFVWGFPDRGVMFSPEAHAKTDRSGTYDLGKGRVLTKTIGHVRTHYVDRSRINLRDMAVKAVQAIQRSVPEVMVRIENDKQGVSETIFVSVGDKTREFGLGKVGDLYELNWKLMDIYDFLARQLPPNSDLEGVEYSSINGALGTLDPHSILLSPRMFREMQVGTKGKFGGLGIVISIREGFLTVMSVMSSTPAERSGVKSADKIVQIGAESTVNMPLNDAVSRLRGKPGTPVTIWVRRKGETKLLSFPIVREEIQIRSVEHETLSDGIGYIKIRNFQANTTRDLKASLAELRTKKSLNGLVLDLRENPGGLLDQAIEVSDVFLDQGNIVTTVKEGAQEREERHATKADTLTKVPIVVLINRGSASASEIVAGALKHNNRAVIMGAVSYGKGSVQVLYRLDDAALKLTIAQYLTPGDISIQSVGIVPDIEILPIHIAKESLRLHSGEPTKRGEAHLKSHLTSALAKRAKSAMRLRVLLDKKGPKPGEPDQLTVLAKAFLKSAQSNNRKKALLQASSVLGSRAKVEDRAIGSKLGELKVNWEEGTNPRKPKIRTQLTLSGDKDTLRAGDTVVLKAELTNESSRPLYRLHGVMKSAIGFVDGVECVFGKIEPGETRSWSTTLNVPNSQHSASDRMEIDLFSNDETLGIQAAFDVDIKGHPRPLFGYSSQVLDDTARGGNGNGMVQRGETIELAVTVFNKGLGDALDVMATIKNESGEHVYIDEGRSALGKIPAGTSKLARFKLKVKAPLKERNIQLKLSIIDQKIRTWTHDEISLPVFPSEFAGSKSKNGWISMNEESVPLKAGAHRDTATLHEFPQGLKLRAVGETQDYVEVRSAEGEGVNRLRGWVSKAKTSWLTSAPERPDTWAIEPQYEAPIITFKTAASYVTNKEAFDLSGTVRFDADSPRKSRSFYVFRGEDKVFFRSGGANSSVIDFDTKITLNKGSNDLVLIARESNTHVTRRYITVFRR